MNQRLDDHPLHDPELDARLTAAMHRIAADYRPVRPVARVSDGGRRRAGGSIPAVHGPGRTVPGRRRRLLAGASAAAAVVVGIGGVVAVTGPSGDSTGVSSSIAREEAVWVWGDGFVVPDVPAPRWGVRFDASLPVGEHDLEIVNRHASWLYTTEPTDARWFVLLGERPEPSGTINVSDYPAHAVNPDDADPEDADGDGVRVLTWVEGGRGRVMTISGAPADAAVESVRSSVDAWQPLADLAVPDGYAEIAYRPFDVWLTTPAVVRPGAGVAQGSAWSAGVLVPVDDTADLIVASAGSSPDAEPIPGGWAIPGDPQWDLWFRDTDTGLVVTVRAPSALTSDEVAALPGLVSVVAADELVEQPLRVSRALPDGTVETIEAMAPMTAGEIPGHGRWAALDSTPDDAGAGVHCVTFIGVLNGAGGCTDPAGRLMVCADLVAGNELRGNDPVLITNDMAVEPTWLAVESAGGGVGYESGDALSVSTSGGLRVVRRTAAVGELNQLKPASFVFGAGRIPAPVVGEPEHDWSEALCGRSVTGVYGIPHVQVPAGAVDG